MRDDKVKLVLLEAVQELSFERVRGATKGSLSYCTLTTFW
jgi:hypothetical protein